MKATWERFLVTHGTRERARLDEMIDNLRPSYIAKIKEYSLQYKRKYITEDGRERAREEAQLRPWDEYYLKMFDLEIYINYDKRKKKYFVQKKDEANYRMRNIRFYEDNFEEAKIRFRDTIAEEFRKWLAPIPF